MLNKEIENLRINVKEIKNAKLEQREDKSDIIIDKIDDLKKQQMDNRDKTSNDLLNLMATRCWTFCNNQQLLHLNNTNIAELRKSVDANI
jgi:virulence-associated protein VapD